MTFVEKRPASATTRPSRRMGVLAASIGLVAISVGCSATGGVDPLSQESDLSRSTRFMLGQFAGDPDELARASRRFADGVAADSATTLRTVSGAPSAFRDDLVDSSRRTADNVADVAGGIADDVERFPSRFQRFLRLLF